MLRRLDDERVTTSSFPRKVLWSWTKDKGARWLAKHDPPRLLRVKVNAHPPDDAWYDVHLRASDDDEVRSLLESPRFDHVRWAWTDVWGACDGLDGERYGDQLVRIELKDDAVFAVFVPRTDDGLGGAVDASNPFRFGLPEWSFVDVEGRSVARAEVLAHPERLAAVYHHSPSRVSGAWAGLREIVLVNEAEVRTWSLGDAAVIDALDDGARLVRSLSRLDAVPTLRPDDAEFVSRLLRSVDGRPLEGELDLESTWMLTLPFPRAQYRDLDRLAGILEEARAAQHFHRVVVAEP